ncbi:hypothetical protein Cgig2_011531 [Carnegiea gigantea]|uniref:Uncharacterized protein n=1 Tax=Carnegiea gigantea TaxID=171969 RepID=A0A9Q1GSC6_9CARY|nr:hypothetical protein Cgig2_011531 [Carnegiea gigantea]
MKEMRTAATADDKVTIRAKHRDEEGKTIVEKVEVHTYSVDTIKHIERKLVDTGVSRLERHPADGKGPLKKAPPKKGHGGKFTWEGPEPEPDTELEAEPAIDEGDPNYVEEEYEEEGRKGRRRSQVKQREEEEEEEEAEKELIKGEVEVAKAPVAKEGVARIDVDPHLGDGVILDANETVVMELWVLFRCLP